MSKQLNLKDRRTTIKWCNEKGIEIHSIGKKKKVNQFLVNVEIDRNLISSLKEEYPLHWKKLYRYYSNGDKTSYMLLIDSISSEKELLKLSSDIPKKRRVRKRRVTQSRPKADVSQSSNNNRKQLDTYVPQSSLATSFANS